jgi:hypothetical protein
MADPKKKEEEVKGILSDLESIFSATPAGATKPQAVPVPPPPAKKAPEPPPAPPAPTPPPPPPPVEKEPEPPPPPPSVEKAPEPPPPPPPVEKAPEPAPAAQPAAPPAPEPPAPAAAPVRPKELVIGGKKVPYEQVRRVAIYYSAGEKKAFDDFVKFFSEMAQKVSKKPLYADLVFELEWSKALDAGMGLSKAKQAGAVAVLCLFNDIDKEGIGSEMQEVFGREDFFLRIVPITESLRRSTAVDLVVDLMLANPG